MMTTYTPVAEKLFINGIHIEYPKCFICKEVIVSDFISFSNYFVMPNGSDFVGAHICGTCAHKHVDPMLHKLKEVE